jgi:SAM-dependent methyltransferase
MTADAFERQVRDCYSTWGETYYDEYYGDGAPYPPVHRDLLVSLLREAGARRVLDAGAGPASFLRDLDPDEFERHGFDLTPEMVAEAQRVLGGRGEVWQGSVLDRGSYRGGPYDAVVCVGVMPHVPPETDETVLANVVDAVRPGGLVAVEARNELFALFTLNRYTYDFFRESLLPDVDEARLAPLKELLRMDLPPVRGGKAGEPGYDEVLSRTHNPFVLRAQAEAAGLRDVRTLFYHYHDVPPMLGPSVPASVALEDPHDWRGHFLASAFVVAGTRASDHHGT